MVKNNKNKISLFYDGNNIFKKIFYSLRYDIVMSRVINYTSKRIDEYLQDNLGKLSMNKDQIIVIDISENKKFNKYIFNEIFWTEFKENFHVKINPSYYYSGVHIEPLNVEEFKMVVVHFKIKGENDSMNKFYDNLKLEVTLSSGDIINFSYEEITLFDAMYQTLKYCSDYINRGIDITNIKFY